MSGLKMTSVIGIICVVIAAVQVADVYAGHSCVPDYACDDLHCDQYHEHKCLGVDLTGCYLGGFGRRGRRCTYGHCECVLKPLKDGAPCWFDMECKGLTCAQPHHAKCQGPVTAGCNGGSGGCTQGHCHCV